MHHGWFTSAPGADIGGDGAVGSADNGEVVSRWGAGIGAMGYSADADLDRDGQIGGSDLAIRENRRVIHP